MQQNATLTHNRVHLADSIRGVADMRHPLAVAIMDRGRPLSSDIVNAVLDQSIFSWEGRNPLPALDMNGEFQCTDLDLLSFLVPLSKRGAVIEIPRYRNRRQTRVREGERKIGTNQFGPIKALVSHRDALSFSVRIDDHTIAVENGDSESLGAYRTYMIVDVDGQWYDGWDKIVFKPNAPENAFLEDKRLWTGNTVYFKHYVHPNRAQSFFGAPYLLLKMLLARVADEARFWRNEEKRLAELGYVVAKKAWPQTEAVGGTESIQAETIEVELDLPLFAGSYSEGPAADGIERATYAYQRAKELAYRVNPAVQFVARADEAAFLRYGNGRRPSWAMHLGIEEGYVLPKKRVQWNRIRYSSELAVRFRKKQITQRVAA